MCDQFEIFYNNYLNLSGETVENQIIFHDFNLLNILVLKITLFNYGNFYIIIIFFYIHKMKFMLHL